jgi:hypothetical protein
MLHYDSKTDYAPEKKIDYNSKTDYAPEKKIDYNTKTRFAPEKKLSGIVFNYLYINQIYKKY